MRNIVVCVQFMEYSSMFMNGNNKQLTQDHTQHSEYHGMCNAQWLVENSWGKMSVITAVI